ncbi:protein mono-ADP-ribosyltransferase PARP14-like [Mustelus asterias]
MAGFPVLVEGLPVELDSVKSKLAIYFQSRRRSGGGECEIRALPDQGKLLVYFKNEEVQKNVVKKEFHTVQLLSPEPVQLRVTRYEWGSNGGSSVSPIRVTANSNKEPAIEQNQLLISSQKYSKCDQSPVKGFQNQESPDPVEESVLESSEGEESYSSQLLVHSDGPVDTDVVAMYFERFISDVEISENDECSWFVTCPSSDDLDKILSQKQHKLGGKTLQVQIYDKDKEDEKYEPRTFLLRGFDVHSRLGHISLYIDSLSNSTKHHIEPLQDGETVAVTFETDIDAKSFLRNCCQKPFENRCITAQRLVKTNSLQVEGVHPSCSDEFLDLYFSNTKRSGGGEITEIIYKKIAMTAIVGFQDHEVVRRVTGRKHSLKDLQLTVSHYYHDLQLSLYGNNGPKIKQPQQFDISINPTLLNYIQKTHLYRKELDEIAKGVYCNITFTDSPNSKQMILKPSFDVDILLCYKIAKDWKKHAEEAIWKFIRKFDFKDFPADEDLWEKVENKSRGLKAPGLDVLYCSTENKVVIVGEESKVLDTSRRLQEILEKAGRELEVERNTVEEQILVESLEELEFLHRNVNVTVSSVQISTSTAPPAFKLKGLKEEVDQVHKVIGQFQSQLERKSLNQSSHLIDFIKSLELKKFVQTHFVGKGITATLVQRQSVELVALKADVKKGEDKIKQLFQEVRINFTPEQTKVAEGDKWKRFLDDLKFDLKSKEVGCRIIEEKNQAAVIIVGYSDIVSDAAKIITSYLDNKTVITQLIPATLMQVDYLESSSSLTELPEIRNKGIIISYIRTDPPGLKVSGAAEHIKEAVSAIEDRLSRIQSVTYTYNKPGEARALSEHKDILEVKAKRHGCMLLIKTKEEGQGSLSLPKPLIEDRPSFMPRMPFPHVQRRELLPTQLTIHDVVVEVKQGDITQERVEAIVNSTNATLNLNSGVSGAIFAAAGNTVMDECKQLGSQPNGGVVVTGSGNLSCDYIIHMVGQTNLALITASVEKVLLECENHQVTTVSFPALGTGLGGMKPQDAIESMLTGFGNHLSQKKPSVIRRIYIVVFERKVYDVFSDVLQRKSQQTWNPTEINFGTVKVIAVQGDITAEQTDAIVNSTTVNLNRKNGVSGAILKAAGQSVVDECNQLGVQSSESIVTTTAGNLRVKYILHLVEWTKTKDTKASFDKVLEQCENLKLSSVSFPAIGAGLAEISPIDVANALLDAISDYASDFVQPSLSLIRIVLFEPLLMAPFRQCMEQRFRTSQAAAQTTFSAKPVPAAKPTPAAKPIPFFKSMLGFKPVPAVKTVPTVYPIILSATKYLNAMVEVYGITKNDIAKAQKHVEDLIKEKCQSKTISNKYVACFSDDERRQITGLCESHQLRVEIQQTKITIDGHHADILESFMEVNAMLQAVKGREDRKQEETQVKRYVQWEFVQNGAVHPYDQSLNCDLEKAYKDKTKSLACVKNGIKRTIDFNKMKENDSQGNVMDVKRRLLEGAIAELPANWSNMRNEEILIVPLQSSTTEYKDVAEAFTKSCHPIIVDIVKIDRVQNCKLWQSYSVNKEAAERKNPGLNVEQILYHGTTKEISDKVNKTGFNRSFCGRNATSYGKGTYFALNASYSCNKTYSNPDSTGCQYIYQARVITGRKCKGQQGMLEPTPVNAQNDPTDLCDCAVNHLAKPTIFVVFCDAGAYPEYLITFKLRTG